MEYSYNVPESVVNVLPDRISQSSMTDKNFDWIKYENNILIISFPVELSADDKTILDGLVQGDLQPEEQESLKEYVFDKPLHLIGEAVKYKSVGTFGYLIKPQKGTFNNINCKKCGKSVIDGSIQVLAFSPNKPQAATLTFKMPTDYKDGTDFKLCFNWTSVATSGSVRYGVGVKTVSTTGSYGQVSSFVEGTSTAPNNSLEKQEVEITFSGLNTSSNDDICIIMYRNTDHADDTMADDALVSSVILKYESDKWGE